MSAARRDTRIIAATRAYAADNFETFRNATLARTCRDEAEIISRKAFAKRRGLRSSDSSKTYGSRGYVTVDTVQVRNDSEPMTAAERN